MLGKEAGLYLTKPASFTEGSSVQGVQKEPLLNFLKLVSLLLNVC